MILSIEGARPLGPPSSAVANLTKLYAAGLRDLQLAWEGDNAVHDGNGNLRVDVAGPVIQRANKLGILLDLSHMVPNELVSSLQLHRDATGRGHPIIVSHASLSLPLMEKYWSHPDNIQQKGLHAQAFHAHPKAKRLLLKACSDPQGNNDDSCVGTTQHLNAYTIASFAEDGGLIGVHFGQYVENMPHEAQVKQLAEEIDVIGRLVGFEYVALGPDYMPDDSQVVLGAYFGDGLFQLVARLRELGISPREACRVLGGNLLEVYTAAFTKTERAFISCQGVAKYWTF